MPVGTKFKFRGMPAEVVWVDHVKYLIVEGDPKAKDVKDQADVYFKNSAIYFTCEGMPEGVTLTTCFPKPELIESVDFSI